MRYVALVSLLLLVVGCKPGSGGRDAHGGLGSADNPSQGPAISCDEPVYDFGVVEEGEEVNHIFIIKNKGTDVLKIASARGSCGCTATVVSNNEIPPGGEGQIQVRLSTQGRVGVLEKTVSVSSNDPVQPNLVLKMKGKVEQYLSFDPAFLNLGKVLKGTKKTSTVKLSGKLSTDAKLLSIAPSDPKALSVKLLDEKTIEVVFDASQIEGRFSGTVVAETNLEKPKNVKFRVSAWVVQDLFFEPDRVYLSEVTTHKRHSAQVKVLSFTGKPFSIKRAYDPQGFVQVGVERDGKNYNLGLSLTKAPSEGHGVVIVETDRKDQKHLEIPYVVAKKDALPIKRLRQPMKK